MMAKFYPIFVTPLPPEEGGCFLAVVPDLKGCMSHGDTEEEAVASVKQAIDEWIAEAKALGRTRGSCSPAWESPAASAERAKALSN